MEELLALLKTLEESEPPPGVLSGIDLKTAPADVRKVAKTVRDTKLDLVVEKQSLDSVLAILKEASGLTFIVTPKAREAMKEMKETALELTLSLRGLTLENVLNLLAVQLGDCRFTVRYGAVLLVQKDEYRPVKTFRMYEVRDLIRRRPDFVAPTLALETTGTGNGQKTR